MRNTRMLGAVAVAAVVTAGVAGCTTGEPGTGDALDLCYVTAAESHAYVTPANEAFDEAAAAAGATVNRLSQEFDVQKGTDQLTTCVSQGADGIVLWPLDPQAYIPGMIAAQDAGIPLIIINSPMDAEAEAYYDSFTGPDVYEEGQLSADALDAALGGSGSVVVIAGQAGNGTTIGRTDGFTERLTEIGSAIEVLQTVNADFDQQKALEASRDLLTRFGDDIDGVYANDDTMALGFIDAWTESGRDIADIPPIVGINGQVQAFDLIKEGQYFATVVQSPYEDGKLAAETIITLAQGGTVDKRLPIPLTVVTAENVDSVDPAF